MNQTILAQVTTGPDHALYLGPAEDEDDYPCVAVHATSLTMLVPGDVEAFLRGVPMRVDLREFQALVGVRTDVL